MKSGAEMLRDAAKVVEDRHKTYGPPTRNFQNIAELWQTYLSTNRETLTVITPADVAVMMVLVKVARLIETPNHLDSWTDIAGYAACGVEVSGAGVSEVEGDARKTVDAWIAVSEHNPLPDDLAAGDYIRVLFSGEETREVVVCERSRGGAIVYNGWRESITHYKRVASAPGKMPNIDHNPVPYWNNPASGKSNPSTPLVSEDVSEDEFNR